MNSDGNTVAVGASNNDGNGSDAGHVRIFNWNGSNWFSLDLILMAKLQLILSGYSVSLNADGNRLPLEHMEMMALI